MKKFKFQFQPVLNYRIGRRDLCRQLLADIQRQDGELVEERAELENKRRNQLREMRDLGTGGSVDIDGAAARRYHAGQLTIELRLNERNREILAEQLRLCRQALVRADQDVKVMEKLRDKQRDQHRYEQEKRAAHELEDTWRPDKTAEVLT